MAAPPPRYNDVGVFSMASRAFTVLLKPQKDSGFFVECPELKGCYSQGDTIEDALVHIREAIELCLEDEEAPGEPAPVLVTSVIVGK